MPKEETKKTNSQTETAPVTTNPEIGPDHILTLTFPWSEIEPLYNKALVQAAKNLKAPGFRPGKVPPQIAESKVDPERLANKTLQKILPDAYEKEVTQQKITPLIQPEFVLKEAEKNQDWVIEAHVAIKPEIKLGNYQQLLKKAKATAKKEIETAEKNKAAEAKKEAEATKKALTKKKDDQKADVVEMNPALQPLTPEQIENQILDRAVLELRAELKPVLPEVLVKKQAQQQLQELVTQLQDYNIELDDYLKNTGQSFDQLAASITQDALHRLQLDFIVQALTEAEKITASDQEIHTEFEKIFMEQNQTEHHHENEDHNHDHDHADHDHQPSSKPTTLTEEQRKTLEQREQDPYYKAYVSDLIKRRKLFDFLKKLS